MNTELLTSKLLEAAFNGSLTHADTSKWEETTIGEAMINVDSQRIPLSVAIRKTLEKNYDYYGASGVIDKVDKFLFDKPLLLIGEDGANLLSRSTPIAFIANGKYWVNNHAHVLEVKEGVSLEFVCHYINSISLVPYVTGVAQPKLNQENLNQIPIPLPPLHEQERIVSALEEGFAAIDAIAEAKANLSNTAEMLRSKILQAAFDGSLTGADISKWEHRQLREISTKIVDGDHNPPKGQKNPTPHIMLSSQNINENKFVAMNKVRYLSKEDFAMCHKRTNLTKGDVLLTSVGTVGRSCVHDSDEKYCFQRSVTIITPTINSYFLKYYFDSPAFQQMLLLGATGNAQKGFYLNQLKEVIIPLPPLAEQERIVAKIESLFTEIDKLSK